jgi:hypothetical protein
MSEFVDDGVPFGCDALVATVVVDEADEVEEMDEDELLRCMGLRGMKIPLTSSVFIELTFWGPSIFHAAERFSCWKEGGFATAVMGRCRR